MMVVDAGLHMTLPYPALLRKERAVDVFLSFDFSGRECDSNIVVPFEVRPAVHQFTLYQLFDHETAS